MNLKTLKEQRGAKWKQLEPLTGEKLNRARTADENTQFDAISAEIEAIDKNIDREERALGFSTSKAEQVKSELGLNNKELRSYSLMKVINALASNKALDGLEGEASQAEARRVGRDPDGVFIPAEIFSAHKRAGNQAATAADGGYVVGMDIDYSNMVELLRNQAHVLELGARVITGLKGDVSIPRVLTGATAYWVNETGTITQTSATFGQIQMKPRRLGASIPYSKQFLAQSGISVEQFIRDDVMLAFGRELDRVAINGQGGLEPLGILNMATADRATSVTFGGQATWPNVIAFETNVATANALGIPGGGYAYLTTPATKGKWKGQNKVTNQAVFLWENGDMVNGYPGRATNQFPTSGTLNQVIFGQFGQVIYGEWAGIDVTVDPYGLAKNGQVQITIQKFVDMIVRQGKAFAISADSGAQ